MSLFFLRKVQATANKKKNPITYVKTPADVPKFFTKFFKEAAPDSAQFCEQLSNSLSSLLLQIELSSNGRLAQLSH